jgi:DNA (cytosine-5)-methyltransferase 1
LKFIDLFAGIGGIRIAFEKQAGCECVFSSEIDKFAVATYETYFGDKPFGDITKIKANEIPKHDILTAGFPCQPFSLAGVSKLQSLGRKHGFDDPARGTLFFEIKRILKSQKPKAFLLENVKNLEGHDGGKTFKVIKEALRGLGYTLSVKVVDAAGWVPQHRERIFLVGFHPDLGVAEGEFEFPDPPSQRIDLTEVIEARVDKKYILGDGVWKTLQRHKAHHESIGNGFGYGLILKPYGGKTSRTLSARYHKDGSEILIDRGKGKNPRRLTPLECARLQGFPDDFQMMFAPGAEHPVSDTQAYRQFGNSVAVPLVTDIARDIVSMVDAKTSGRGTASAAI